MNSLIPDQRGIWDTKHGNDDYDCYHGEPSPFAQEALECFEPGSNVLELGCGAGGDTMFIAQNGHPIVGVDFSDVALKRHSFDHPNLMYVQADISDALPVKDGAFDNVLAHLSLHYYDDKTTHEVFAEVARVLKPGGVFAFACKSISDPDFGHGEKIEKNLFVSDKGHVRHFFSRGYAHDLTDGLFVVERIEEVQEDYKANKSASFIRCISRRI